MRDNYDIISIFLACMLHIAVFSTLILAFETSDANIPVRPLLIQASIISEENLITPQKKRAQERKRAEEKKRLDDIKAEKIKKEKIEIAEKKKIEDLKKEQERIKKEAIEKKKKEEEDLEKRRIQAEQERLEDIKRQRAENEKKRKEIEEAEKQAQLDRELANEQKRLDALRSGALTRYMYALMTKIENNWIQPASAGMGISCTVSVRQLPGGEVVSANVEVCNGDESVRRSIEAAVYKSSPLPNPEDPSLFERNLKFIFEPIQ
ncbi:MAG: cell envelope integrity protein TolA [Pseudomonadota bacterium]|nr:cell envelope integrity protein TolA [Pseudomonadota bacterium]